MDRRCTGRRLNTVTREMVVCDKVLPPGGELKLCPRCWKAGLASIRTLPEYWDWLRAYSVRLAQLEGIQATYMRVRYDELSTRIYRRR